jgi:hypothetical protein
MRIVLILVLFVPLAGCGSGAEMRKAMAECQLSPKSHEENGDWDEPYLTTCMQSKGYVFDAKLKMPSGDVCGETAIYLSETDAACYREDDAFHDFWADHAE